MSIKKGNLMTIHKPEFYDLVMDESKNPLSTLPKVQRFQLMVVLSCMWTTIFCLGMGSWLWWGELIVGHVGVALGLLVTGLTFTQADIPEERPARQEADGLSE